jgi:rhomboid protease GluP
MIGNRQPITTTLVGMNVAVFTVMALTGISPTAPTSVQLLKWGANWGPLSLGAEPWRILASNYIHGGIIHIALNMWCLWNLGFLAERVFDPWTYVLTYTFCGLAGSLASLWWHPLAVGVGASGAIFGLAGALIAALYLGHLPISKQAIQGTLKSLLTFAGYNLFFGAVAQGIDNSAHIGGLLAGLALGGGAGKTSYRCTGNPRRMEARRFFDGRSRAVGGIHAGEARQWEHGAKVAIRSKFRGFHVA